MKGVPNLPICYRARQITSPDKFSLSASLASNHSYSLLLVLTTAISPIPNGATCWALRPEQILRISPTSMNIFLLGRLISSILFRTGRSSRYLSSAQIRLRDSLASMKALGDGPSIVPRVTARMKPERRRMERIPRF